MDIEITLSILTLLIKQAPTKMSEMFWFSVEKKAKHKPNGVKHGQDQMK